MALLQLALMGTPNAGGVSIPAPGWLRELWTAQGILEGAVEDRAHGSWPANVSFAQILDTFVPPAARDKFVINLGANDGARHDPSFPLLVERGYGGIVVEGDPAFKKRLYTNLRPFNSSGRLHISWGFASASTIGPKLLKQGCPLNPDALKIDVDGLDAALMEGILTAGIKPKAIVVEVNPDIPPPLQLSQLYHDAYTFEFQRKHMRGWLGASADALYTQLGRAGYALVAFELGTREHMVCSNARGGTRMCKRKGTCSHCENNMWFVRADLLRDATGLEPPTWPQFVNAFWKQTFAFNTYAANRVVFKDQAVSHHGLFTRADTDKPYMPECYSLSEHQYYQAQAGESFTKPACPLQTLRSQLGPGAAAQQAGGSLGWRAWAKHSLALAKPAHAAKAASFATAVAEGIKAPACRPDETCPFNATATTYSARAARGVAQQGRALQSGRQLGVHRTLEAMDYRRWVKSPEQVARSPAVFLMNKMSANHGHVRMAQNFTSLLGFHGVDQGGLAKARLLQAAGTPFAYMTLTNDHQPLTEHGHDATLQWERSSSSRSAAGVFIGPPGKHVLEGPRKAIFCELSEGLAKRTGDPWQRFAPPCVTRDRSGQAGAPGEEYATLLRNAPPIVKAPGYDKDAAPPRWLTRKVNTKRVSAAGAFMYPLSHEKAMASNFTIMQRYAPLLMRYIDPPLLQQAVHLGTPVRTRVEVRIFGMVQWEPLRIWTSRYGFFRGGTPWMNYSAKVAFDASNGAMWNVNRGVEAKCEPVPPANPPPWRDEASYSKCKNKRGGKAKPDCCICLTVADVFDIEHDEQGFATSGTLRRLEHVAVEAGFDARRVWQSVDEALIREFIAEQHAYQREASGAPLSRWATLFSADVGFAADGRAVLYENLLMPNWKRPGYFWHEAVDRAAAIGIYSGQMLAMAPLLVDAEADASHAALLEPLKLEPQAHKEAFEFLRTQGLARELGFRRTWPTLQRAPAHAFDSVADTRDLDFARLLNQQKLLLSNMDVLSEAPPTDLWGGPSANPAERGASKWPVGHGKLWNEPTGGGRGAVCDDRAGVLSDYRAKAAARDRIAQKINK